MRDSVSKLNGCERSPASTLDRPTDLWHDEVRQVALVYAAFVALLLTTTGYTTTADVVEGCGERTKTGSAPRAQKEKPLKSPTLTPSPGDVCYLLSMLTMIEVCFVVAESDLLRPSGRWIGVESS